jgi:uncharacterized membrane protein
MNVALWIIAGLLAIAFATGGVSKLSIPKQKIATLPGGEWVEDFSPDAVKATGALDLLAAAGLILPAALNIAPVLVPVAAVGVVLLMAGAVIVRLRHGSRKAILGDLAYLALAGFLAWGRFGPETF